MSDLNKILELVKKLNKSGDHKKVIDTLDKEILNQLQSADLYAEKAQAYYRLKSFDNCKKAIEKSLNIDNNNAKALHYKGNLFYDDNEYNEAIKYYNKAIKSNSKFSFPYHGLGITYSNLKEHKKAIKNFNKAIEIDPDLSVSYISLGKEYSKVKEFDNAIEAFKKGISLDPYTSNGIKNLLGIAYKKAGKYKLSIECFSEILKTDNDFDPAHYNRAQTYHLIEDYKNSLKGYKKYIELTNSAPDYYTSIAKSKVKELKKLINDAWYSKISDIVKKIKSVLLYEEDCATHYTSLSVAKALILDSSKFRLSEGTFLNDTSEGRELFKFLEFNFNIKKQNETLAKPYAIKPFIGSFVSDNRHDDLTLWRMYGKEQKEEAKGCAITFVIKEFFKNIENSLVEESIDDTSPIINNEFRFYKVAYREKSDSDIFSIPGDDKEKVKELNTLMNNLNKEISIFKSRRGPKKSSDIQNLEELLNEIAYLFKSNEYKHEHELRLVVKAVGFEKIIDTATNPIKVYIELAGIRQIINKITLGPKVERADEWASAFYYSLEKDDSQPEILISHLPFK